MRAATLFLVFLLLSGMPRAQSGPSGHPVQPPAAGTRILTGADQLDQYLPLLQGQSVAVFANATSVIGHTHLVDTLVKLGIHIQKIFSPEHGFRGDADAGAKVGNGTDPATGIPVISLYGNKTKPTTDDLAGVDVLLYDIQDVGVRFYTYIASLQRFLEAAIGNNRPLIILARSFLNPGRTFSNLMAFKVPWQRDTRIGLFGANYELRKELVQEFKEEGGEKPFEFVRDAYKPAGVEFKHDYPREAPIELTAFPEYESFLGGGSCIGGGGTGAARVNPKLQVVAEVNGCLIMHQPTYNMSADSLSYSGGLRWTPLASHRISPFLQMKFGGRKVTTETDDLELKKQLLDEWNNGSGTLAHYPVRSDWSAEAAVNGPMLSVGGGLDVVITRPFAWRVLNVEYSHTWINNIGGIHPQNGVLIATEAVVRIGTW